jgi:hypothetical protein
MTLGAMPVARAAAAMPPEPQAIASSATNSRRALSDKLLRSLRKRARIFAVAAARLRASMRGRLILLMIYVNRFILRQTLI